LWEKKIDAAIYLLDDRSLYCLSIIIFYNRQAIMEAGETKNERKSIAVVIPVFNEQDNVDVLCDRLGALIAAQNEYSWKLIFVDDGSKDATTDRLKARLEGGLPISIIRFSRNFGHQAAIKAGLDCAEADAVITMDGDGQHPPEFVPKLLELWRAGNQVVQTVRAPEQENEQQLRQKLTRWAYEVINWFADRPIPSACADFRLIDRVVLNELKSMPETEPMLRGLVAWVGFRQTTLEYQVQSRLSGESRYSLRQMFKLLAGGIFDMSRKPLGFASVASAVLAGMGLLGWLIGLVSGVVFWLFFLTSLELLSLGLVGAYLGRAYMEVLDRPMYIISEKVNFEEVTPSQA
jgi:dolichol-phosphate mannosyltransferase